MTVKLTRPAKVAIKVERRVKSRGRWVWESVQKKSLAITARGRRTLTVRARRGSAVAKYRVTATAAGAAKRALNFKV